MSFPARYEHEEPGTMLQPGVSGAEQGHFLVIPTGSNYCGLPNFTPLTSFPGVIELPAPSKASLSTSSTSTPDHVRFCNRVGWAPIPKLLEFVYSERGMDVDI